MNYYVARDGEPQGPFTHQQLAQQGITPDTLVYNETMANWTPAGSIPELQAMIFGGATPAAAAPNGGYVPCNGPAPGNQQPMQPIEPQPKTWLVESILATLFCCLPLGIVGIVYASQVSSSYSVGDYKNAKFKSQMAGKWVKASFIVGLLGILLYFVFVVLLGVGASMM